VIPGVVVAVIVDNDVRNLDGAELLPLAEGSTLLKRRS